MINIKLKKNIIEYTKDIVEQYDFGQRGRYDGTKLNQYFGILAENTVRDYVGVDLIEPKGFDGGWDIMYKGYKSDIKTMNRKVYPKPHYVNNFLDVQRNHNSEAFIFTSLHLEHAVLTICGWITKKEFLNTAKFYSEKTKRFRDDGTFFEAEADLWEIENKYLYTFE